jgi:hypothetical protein
MVSRYPPWPGESQLTPFPLPPLPISISPSPLLPTCFLLFLHHSTPIYIHQRHFYTYPASLFCFIPALSPYPPFRFFGIFYGCSPATSTIPHPYILTSIVFPCPLTSAWPIPSPCLYLPPLPPFRFFDTFCSYSHATSTIPHPYILTSIVFPCPLTPAWPIPSSLPTYLPPYPPFRFFGPFMDAFWCTFISYSIYMCTYMIYSIE